MPNCALRQNTGSPDVCNFVGPGNRVAHQLWIELEIVIPHLYDHVEQASASAGEFPIVFKTEQDARRRLTSHGMTSSAIS